MGVTWSTAQKQRLIELNADPAVQERLFRDSAERDECYQEIESGLVSENKKALMERKNSGSRPVVAELEEKLAYSLCKEGFVRVSTPIIIAKSMLEKMTITSDSDLARQVFWLDQGKCLRPMLAPNLYSLMRDLYRIWGDPVRIFEIGPCFRKESQGKSHLNEFTMLNLVELGVPEGRQRERLNELVKIVMDTVRIEDYRMVADSCQVYGETVDVLWGDLELSSGAFGPHRLDYRWGIFDPWVGLGLGLERLSMAIEGHRNIRRVGRSISYLNGIRLNI